MLDLRHPSRRKRNSIKMEFSEKIVVLRRRPLALEDLDEDISSMSFAVALACSLQAHQRDGRRQAEQTKPSLAETRRVPDRRQAEISARLRWVLAITNRSPHGPARQCP